TPYRLALIDAKSGNKRYLTDPPAETWGDTNARFSPDGKQLLICRHISASLTELLLQDFDSQRGLIGQPRQVSAKRGELAEDAAWTPDGQFVLFTSGQDHHFWIASVNSPNSAARIAYTSPQVRMPDIRKTLDGRWELSFVQNDHDVDIVRIPIHQDGS